MCMMHYMMGHSKYEEPHNSISHGPDPLDIAKKRFALGEITREQFEEMVRVLNSADEVPVHSDHDTH